ncbi:MAG TPA: zf-HC2 domain-containing protein [Bryobacteraceae bacterium]|nr:zf-HC2 domain-containing protein [Bryobacteraceae bacterium]
MQIFTSSKHITEEALSLHAMNDLTESRTAQVAAHLTRCNHCHTQFREAQEFVGIVRLLAKRQGPYEMVGRG